MRTTGPRSSRRPHPTATLISFPAPEPDPFDWGDVCSQLDNFEAENEETGRPTPAPGHDQLSLFAEGGR